MRIGSLFSGIGGLELGLEWAGVGHTVWQVEQDPYCLAVLAKHWPDARRFTDVREVGAHNLPAVDVICGGFPCQDISYAGKGAGLAGERSGLWSHYRRLIEEIRPSWVVIENVSALRSRGLDVVLGEIAALGYDAEWHCIPASAVGAPHRRDRVWIVADAVSERPATGTPSGLREGSVFDGYWNDSRTQTGRAQLESRLAGRGASVADSDECSKPVSGDEANAVTDRRDTRLEHLDRGGRLAVAAATQTVADAVCSGLEGQREIASRVGAEFYPPSDPRWWLTEPDVGRVANGVPSRVDRLRALGNAVVPQVAEVVGRRLMQLDAELADAA